jgi:hypothetical protein
MMHTTARSALELIHELWAECPAPGASLNRIRRGQTAVFFLPNSSG